jgi:glycosyltransferase involved in cell wall biosynthesis
MKNVCFFNSVKFWGGGEKLHFDYALEFKRKNYNVYLVSKKKSPLSQKANKQGLQVFNISVSNLSFINPLKLIKLVRFYRKAQIDTVIFSGSQDLKLGGIAAKIAKVKNIIYLRGLAVPIKNSFLNRLLYKNILTGIVANSEETKRTILSNLLHIDENKISVIYHGIDIDLLEQNGGKKLDTITRYGHGIILGNAGRLTLQKGQHYLIEVAKKLKEKQIEFTLFIAGTGEMQTQLESLIEKYNLQKEVVLLGFVKDIEAFMNSIDVFLLSSKWEGFGYVLVEAMLKAKPVVAFNISSNPEIVVNNKSGYLTDYPDIDMFTEKVQLLIENESLRKQFGEVGRKTVMQKFQLSDRIDEFENYLLAKPVSKIV